MPVHAPYECDVHVRHQFAARQWATSPAVQDACVFGGSIDNRNALVPKRRARHPLMIESRYRQRRNMRSPAECMDETTFVVNAVGLQGSSKLSKMNAMRQCVYSVVAWKSVSKRINLSLECSARQ